MPRGAVRTGQRAAEDRAQPVDAVLANDGEEWDKHSVRSASAFASKVSGGQVAGTVPCPGRWW